MHTHTHIHTHTHTHTHRQAPFVLAQETLLNIYPIIGDGVIHITIYAKHVLALHIPYIVGTQTMTGIAGDGVCVYTHCIMSVCIYTLYYECVHTEHGGVFAHV